MDRRIAGLERALVSGERTDLAQGALIASGVDTWQELNRYLARLEQLCRSTAGAVDEAGSDYEAARVVFEWLWRPKPHRYRPQGSFRLTEVLEAQGGRRRQVGNCLGLTVLYNVIARRFGLSVRASYMEDAFGRGPHVCSVLELAERGVDIENTLPDGFDYAGHHGVYRREGWGDRELVADIYHSAGNELFAAGEWEGAVVSYEKSIEMNPQYTKAYINKGLALIELGRVDEAERWLREITS